VCRERRVLVPVGPVRRSASGSDDQARGLGRTRILILTSIERVIERVGGGTRPVSWVPHEAAVAATCTVVGPGAGQAASSTALASAARFDGEVPTPARIADSTAPACATAARDAAGGHRTSSAVCSGGGSDPSAPVSSDR
jgi:hypothetical protein